MRSQFGMTGMFPSQSPGRSDPAAPQLKSMPAVLPPRQQRTIVVHLDTSKILGRFDGSAIVHFANPEIDTAELILAAKVVGRIEWAPFPHFLLQVER